MFGKARSRFGDEIDLVELLKNIRGILVFQERMGRSVDYTASYAAHDELRLVQDSSEEASSYKEKKIASSK